MVRGLWYLLSSKIFLFLSSFSTVLMCLSNSSQLYTCSRNRCLSSLQWCSKSFYVVQIRLILSAWLYGIPFFNDFGCSESIWKKLCLSVSFLFILVSSLLFLIYTPLHPESKCWFWNFVPKFNWVVFWQKLWPEATFLNVKIINERSIIRFYLFCV